MAPEGPSHGRSHSVHVAPRRARESSLRMRASGSPLDYRRPMDRPTLWERIRDVNPYAWDGLLAGLVLAVTAFSLGPGFPAPRSPAWRGTAPRTSSRGSWSSRGVRRSCSVAARRWSCSRSSARRPSRSPHAATRPTSVFPSRSRPTPWRPTCRGDRSSPWVSPSPRWRRSPCRSGSPPMRSRSAEHSEVNWVEIVVGVTFAVAIPMLLGRIAFNRRRRLERDRERAARDAVTEERARIARELHDVVAHAMSVMVVQAGAARTVVDRDPEAAKEAIAPRRGDGPLGARRDAPPDRGPDRGRLTALPLAPQPGLDQLDELARRVRARGSPRGASSGRDDGAPAAGRGGPHRLPRRPGGAHERPEARRGRRTLGSRSATRTRDALMVEVADDGRGPIRTRPAGHGLVGMRERVALFGGSLETGARPGGGFVVRARIPLEDRSGAVTIRVLDRRRPGADAGRVPDDPRRPGRHRGGRRGDRRRRRGRSVRATAHRTSS